MSEKPTGYWYCPNCKEEVGSWHVSNAELHELCGHPVEWIGLNKPSYEDLERSLAIAQRALENLYNYVINTDLDYSESYGMMKFVMGKSTDYYIQQATAEMEATDET